jgi:hypothetical protein
VSRSVAAVCCADISSSALEWPGDTARKPNAQEGHNNLRPFPIDAAAVSIGNRAKLLKRLARRTGRFPQLPHPGSVSLAGASGWDSNPPGPFGINNLRDRRCQECQQYHQCRRALHAIARGEGGAGRRCLRSGRAASGRAHRFVAASCTPTTSTTVSLCTRSDAHGPVRRSRPPFSAPDAVLFHLPSRRFTRRDGSS